jgi:hypothetical protein
VRDGAAACRDGAPGRVPLTDARWCTGVGVPARHGCRLRIHRAR